MTTIITPENLARALVALSFTLLSCTRPEPVRSDAGPAVAAPHYGEVMSAVGRRFELTGRAFATGRYELAAFELDELKEVLDDDLPAAAPPKITGNADLKGLADAFRKTSIPALERAVKARDRKVFDEAFAAAAVACNGCHQATGHAFIEIAPEPTAGVPRLDPLPTAPADKR